MLLFCITIEIRWSYVSWVGKRSGGRGDRRGSGQKIRGKSEDGGGNKEQQFWQQTGRNKGGLHFSTTFPSFPSLSAIDPDRPQARCIIIFGATLNKKKEKSKQS